MSLPSQQYAGLAADAYQDHAVGRQPSGEREHVKVDGVDYEVVEHVNNARTGYQGTVYQRTDTREIVVAHRGTEEAIKDGLIADGAMVFNRTNPQAADAIELTRHALQYAHAEQSRTGHAPPVTVTGHSLGGTLAQVTAHHFDLKGETFNAYGAVSLGYRIPEGGNNIINHVMATDVVSAGSHHYGEERVYATQQEIDRLQSGGFSNSRLNMLIPDSPVIVAAGSLGDHSMHNFLNVDGDGRPDRSVLGNPQSRQLAEQNQRMIGEYRDDIFEIRRALTVGARGPLGNAQDLFNELRGPLTPGEPAQREQPGVSMTPAARQGAMRLDEPGHAAFPLYQDAARGTLAQADRLAPASDLQQRQLAGSLAAQMHAVGGTRIDAVAVSQDGARTFGVQGRMDDPAQLRVNVETAQAMNTSLEQSSQRVAEQSAQQAPVREQAHDIQQSQPAAAQRFA